MFDLRKMNGRKGEGGDSVELFMFVPNFAPLPYWRHLEEMNEFKIFRSVLTKIKLYSCFKI